MNTSQTHSTAPTLPLLRRASTLIAMGTVGLALVAAGSANADVVTKPPGGHGTDIKPWQTTHQVTSDRTAVPPTTDQALWVAIRR
jgi:hypothetical protein